MASTELATRVRSSLIKELIRRSLNKYFMSKGFTDSFNKKVYPAMIVDLPMSIPELYNKVEVQPSAENIDPITGIAKLRWDLFILGNQRMCLGTTSHSSLAEIDRAIRGDIGGMSGLADSRYTVSEIIEFIMKILSTSKTGFELVPPNIVPTMMPQMAMNKATVGTSSAGAMYNKSGRA